MNTRLEGISLISHTIHKDNRGSFQKICTLGTNSQLNTLKFSEIAFSNNLVAGTIRGLHFKISPSEEWKLVTCVSGKIFDVVVDVRKNSPTYGEYFAIELSQEVGISVLIPPGFAHGYQSLADNSCVHYELSEVHNSKFDARLRWDDPTIGINWPMKVTKISPLDEGALFWPVMY